MKATQHGQYFKNGRKMYTYKVTGTADEVAKYKAIQETQTNRALGTWPEADGSPLFFLGVETLTRNGEAPQPQYVLMFNNDDTKIIRDTSAQERADWAEITLLKRQAKAQIMAEIELGIRVVGRPAATITTPAAQRTTATIGEAKDLTDSIMQQVGETVEVGEELEDKP